MPDWGDGHGDHDTLDNLTRLATGDGGRARRLQLPRRHLPPAHVHLQLAGAVADGGESGVGDTPSSFDCAQDFACGAPAALTPAKRLNFNGRRVSLHGDSGVVYHYTADHLGSTRVVSTATVPILQDYDYYPFGGARVVVDLLGGQHYRLTPTQRKAR